MKLKIWKAVAFALYAAFSLGAILVGGWNATTQTIIGVVSALPFGLLFYSPQKPDFNVHYVGKAATAYSNLVFDGFKTHLSDEAKLTEHRPANGHFEDPDWQAKTIKKIPKNKLDALVLVPAGSAKQLIDTVIDLCHAKIPVVLIDYKFKNAHFIELGLLPPLFVYANPIETGNLLGSVIETRVRNGVSNLILMLGNDKSAVALYRTQAMMLKALQSAQSQPLKISLIELDAWDFNAQIKTTLAELLDKIVAADEEVVVACPNDAILDEIDRHLPESHFEHVELLGCDGAHRQDGRLILDTSKHGIATVDINPREQGEIAADLVNMRVHKKRNPPRGYNVRRAPQKVIWHSEKPKG